MHALLSSRIVVAIDEWPINSYYPNGHYLYSLGEIGDIEAETAVILTEHQIQPAKFSLAAIRSLPAHYTEWKVLPEEVRFF